MSKTIFTAALLTAMAVAIQEVCVAEDKVICIREMTAGEREDFEKVLTGKGSNQIRSTLIARTVCDESGALLFTDKDIPQLQKLPVSLALKIYDAAAIMNGLKSEAVDKAEQD
jgi:hypothetical protein